MSHSRALGVKIAAVAVALGSIIGCDARAHHFSMLEKEIADAPRLLVHMPMRDYQSKIHPLADRELRGAGFFAPPYQNESISKIIAAANPRELPPEERDELIAHGATSDDGYLALSWPDLDRDGLVAGVDPSGFAFPGNFYVDPR